MKCPPLVLLLIVAGCSSTPDNRYYTLNAYPPLATQAKPSAAQEEGWVLNPITLPAVLDRPQIVERSGENGIILREYDRWAAPLDGMIYHVLAEDLRNRQKLDSLPVADGARKQVAVAIDEFNADESGRVTLSALWSVRVGEAAVHYIYRREEVAGSNSISSIAATMSRLLGDLADTVAHEL